MGNRPISRCAWALLLAVGFVSPIVYASKLLNCVSAIDQSVYGKIAPALRPEVATLMKKFLNRNLPNGVSGLSALAMMQAMGVSREEVLVLAQKALDEQLRISSIEEGILPNFEPARAFIKTPTSLPSFQKLRRQDLSFLNKWEFDKFNFQTLSLELSRASDSQQNSVQGNQWYDYLLLAVELNNSDLAEEFLVRLVQGGSYRQAILGAALLRKDLVIFNLARLVLADFFNSPVTVSSRELWAAITGLQQVRDLSLQSYARQMLYEFAATISHSNFIDWVEAGNAFNVRESRKTQARYFEFSEFALLALYSMGEPDGSQIMEEGLPVPRLIVKNPAAKMLAEKIIVDLPDYLLLGTPVHKLVFWLAPSLDIKPQLKYFSSVFVQNARRDSSKVDAAAKFVAGARFLYAADDPGAARIALFEFIEGNYLYSQTPAGIRLMIQTMAEAGDAPGLIPVRTMLKTKTSNSRSPEYLDWKQMVEQLRQLLSGPPNLQAYVRAFHPGHPDSQTARPFVSRSQAILKRMEQLMRSPRRMEERQIQEKIGYQSLRSGNIRQAILNFQESNSRTGLVAVARQLSHSDDPSQWMQAICLYAQASHFEDPVNN